MRSGLSPSHAASIRPAPFSPATEFLIDCHDRDLPLSEKRQTPERCYANSAATFKSRRQNSAQSGLTAAPSNAEAAPKAASRAPQVRRDFFSSSFIPLGAAAGLTSAVLLSAGKSPVARGVIFSGGPLLMAGLVDRGSQSEIRWQGKRRHESDFDVA